VGPRKEEREACATFILRDSLRKTEKIEEVEECKGHKLRRLHLYVRTVLTRILEVRLEECGFNA